MERESHIKPTETVVIFGWHVYQVLNRNTTIENEGDISQNWTQFILNYKKPCSLLRCNSNKPITDSY